MKKVLSYLRDNIAGGNVSVDYGVFLIFFIITMLFVLTILKNI